MLVNDADDVEEDAVGVVYSLMCSNHRNRHKKKRPELFKAGDFRRFID